MKGLSKFARFQTGGQIKYGIAEGENIRRSMGISLGITP
jgi:hypothetical protein